MHTYINTHILSGSKRSIKSSTFSCCSYIHAHTYTHTCIYPIYIPIYIYAHACIYMYICTHIYISLYRNVYIQIHTHTYLYVYIYTYTHPTWQREALYQIEHLFLLLGTLLEFLKSQLATQLTVEIQYRVDI